MVFAIRKPAEFKGVFTNKESIKKAKESVKGIEGASFRNFQDDELAEACIWAGVKGAADVKQSAVSLPGKTITETEVFLNVIDKYKQLGYSAVEIYFEGRECLGVFLNGVARGELRHRYPYDTVEEQVEYSMDNDYIKYVYHPTELDYTHPVLYFRNAYEVEEQPKDSNILNKKIKNWVDVGINMNVARIVEIKAFDTYSWVGSSYYSTTDSFDEGDYELYEIIKPYI